jgi:hypothetical protein
MSLEESFAYRESSLLNKLKELQSAIDDRTGKGSAAEDIIEELLLRPFLPPGFLCGKGAVICSTKPDVQSSAIDRVIFDTRVSIPLVYDKNHSIFPAEVVAGMVEITMHLDARKLKTDIERMAPVKGMTERRYLVPQKGSKTKVIAHRTEGGVSPRSFIIGLPSDPNWDVVTIAKALREIQMKLGPPTHVHGLYVIGVGFFFTKPVEDKSEPMFRIAGWTGPERIFRFADEFRRAFDRWNGIFRGISVDLRGYVPGEPKILAE